MKSAIKWFGLFYPLVLSCSNKTWSDAAPCFWLVLLPVLWTMTNPFPNPLDTQDLKLRVSQLLDLEILTILGTKTINIITINSQLCICICICVYVYVYVYNIYIYTYTYACMLTIHFTTSIYKCSFYITCVYFCIRLFDHLQGILLGFPIEVLRPQIQLGSSLGLERM